ncbi:MAG: hypothetical protein ACFE7E_09250 [Candidatus Hodarchaeota archaeon]
MPKGIVVIRWDDKVGAVLEAKHPSDFEIDQEHVMRIFTTHALGSANPGFMSMRIEDLNVASYYTGIMSGGQNQYCISLVLEEGEDADAFEETLSEVSKEILEKAESQEMMDFILSAYERFARITEIEDEQRYAMIFSDPLRVLLLQKFIEGSTTKSELKAWLEERTGREITDLDIVLAPFVKTELVKEAFVEGIPDECLFLIKDVFATRAPMARLRESMQDSIVPGDIGEQHLEDVEEYFKEYMSTPDDTSRFSKVLSSPDIYLIIKKLRQGPYYFEELEDELDLYAKDSLPSLIDQLKKLDVVNDIEDTEGRQILLLKSDMKFTTFFPEYLIDVIRKRWNEGTLEQRQAIKHLELLKDSYS